MRLENGGIFDVLLGRGGIKEKKDKLYGCCDISTFIFLCLLRRRTSVSCATHAILSVMLLVLYLLLTVDGFI